MNDIVTRPAEEMSREELYERARLGRSLSKAPNPYATLGLLAEKGRWPCS